MAEYITAEYITFMAIYHVNDFLERLFYDETLSHVDNQDTDNVYEMSIFDRFFPMSVMYTCVFI